MIKPKLKYYLRFILKFNSYYKLKFFSLIIISLVIYYFFSLGISILIDTSYYFEKNYYLSFSTPFILTPKCISEEEIDNFNISLKRQFFKENEVKNIISFEKDLKLNGFDFFTSIVSRGTLIDYEVQYIPVSIFFMDFDNLKYFDGIDISTIKSFDLKEDECIVSEALSNKMGQNILLGTMTIEQDYNIASLKVKYYYKYKSKNIENFTYPVIIISKNMGERLIGFNKNDTPLIFVYKKSSYKNSNDFNILKRIILKDKIIANLFNVEKTDKNTAKTFYYINIILYLLIFVIFIILAILYVLFNYFSLKDRFIIIGIFKCYGMKDKYIFYLFLFEILIFNLISFALSFLFYVLTIKYFFHNYFSLGNIISNQLNIHSKIFIYLFPFIFIQSILSCYALYNRIKKEDVIKIITGGL